MSPSVLKCLHLYYQQEFNKYPFAKYFTVWPCPRRLRLHQSRTWTNIRSHVVVNLDWSRWLHRYIGSQRRPLETCMPWRLASSEATRFRVDHMEFLFTKSAQWMNLELLSTTHSCASNLSKSVAAWQLKGQSTNLTRHFQDERSLKFHWTVTPLDTSCLFNGKEIKLSDDFTNLQIV